MKKQVVFIALGAVITASLATAPAVQAADTAKSVKVFILAGQSNMEGKVFTPKMEIQAEAPKTKDLYKHLRKDGKWIVRDDVFIKRGKRKAPLTVGYGGRRQGTGVELEFGSMMGDHFDEPVLLIKTAWGGHSLYQQFRSPSAFPSAEKLQAELEATRQKFKKDNDKQRYEQALATWKKAHEAALKEAYFRDTGRVRWRHPGHERKKPSPPKNGPLPTMDDIKKRYGPSYRAMLAEVKATFDNYETMFPAWKGRKLEVAGFVWFQGWNDQYFAPKEYASLMKHFIQDVRKDLGVPNMPFVIAAMGQNGSKPAGKAMATIREAQMSMNDVPEFKGNVKAFRTDVLADTKGGADCHYNESPIWYMRIAHAMGESMLELMKGQK